MTNLFFTRLLCRKRNQSIYNFSLFPLSSSPYPPLTRWCSIARRYLAEGETTCMCECVCFIIVLCVSVHCFDGLTDGDPKPIELLWVHSVTTVYEKTSLILLFLSLFSVPFVASGDTNQFPGPANNVASGLFGRSLWDIQSLGALTLAAFLLQIISVSIFVCVCFFSFFCSFSVFFFFTFLFCM